MEKLDLSAQEIFMRLGDTPATRSAQAEKLFRKLRTGERDDTAKALLASSAKAALSASAKKAASKS